MTGLRGTKSDGAKQRAWSAPRSFRGAAMSALAATLGLAAAPTGAQCQYDVTLLPNIGCFGGPGVPIAINNLGHVLLRGSVCNEPGLFRAFLWTGGTTVTPILPPAGYVGARALDLNDVGEVVGEITRVVPGGQGCTIARNEACLWRNGVAIPLGVPQGGNYSIATGINDHSEICGYWGNNCFGNPALRAFIWRDGVMADLALPFGSESMAAGINDASQITGWMGNDPTGDARCFRWSPNGVTDLGVIDGGYTAEGMAITRLGRVAARGRVPAPNYKFGRVTGTLWHGTQQYVVPNLPLSDNMYVWDANDFAVVGEADRPNSIGDRAFIFQNNVTTDLTTVTPGHTIWTAYGINDRGQILAHGRINNVGNSFSMILSPKSLSSADITRDCRVGVADLLAVIVDWQQRESLADITRDGVVDILDLFAVLENWSP